MHSTPDHPDLSYGPAPSHRLDLYLPATPPPHPTVAFFHGGGWAGGDKWPCPAQALTDLGFAVASVNYRLTPAATFPAQLHDVKGAVRWLRGNAGRLALDADRIGAWGISAGAHLAALLGLTAGVAELEGTVGDHVGVPSGVRCVCDWFGPTDLARFADDARSARMSPKPQWPMLVAALLGGPVEHRPAVVESANPVRYVSPAAPPFLIQHGDRDDWVPLGQSRRLADALAAAGAGHTFTVVPGGGHGPGFDAPAVRTAVIGFFREHLG